MWPVNNEIDCVAIGVNRAAETRQPAVYGPRCFWGNLFAQTQPFAFSGDEVPFLRMRMLPGPAALV